MFQVIHQERIVHSARSQGQAKRWPRAAMQSSAAHFVPSALNAMARVAAICILAAASWLAKSLSVETGIMRCDSI